METSHVHRLKFIHECEMFGGTYNGSRFVKKAIMALLFAWGEQSIHHI